MRLERAALLVCIALTSACAAGGGPRSSAAGRNAEAVELQVKMGQEYLAKGDLETAQDKLQRALQLDPKSVDAHTLVAVLNERIKRPEIAERHYRRAVELAPENGAVNNNLGAFLCGRGDYAEAASHFEAAVNDPFYKTPAVAYANAGVCTKKGGDRKAAEAYFRRALELDNRNLSALYELALLSFAKGDALRARAFIQRYEALTPPDAELLSLAWRVETKLGDVRAAKAYEKRLKTDFPGFEPSAGPTPESDSPSQQ